MNARCGRQSHVPSLWKGVLPCLVQLPGQAGRAGMPRLQLHRTDGCLHRPVASFPLGTSPRPNFPHIIRTQSLQWGPPHPDSGTSYLNTGTQG